MWWESHSRDFWIVRSEILHIPGLLPATVADVGGVEGPGDFRVGANWKGSTNCLEVYVEYTYSV